jgi:hypothetical protein
MQAIRTRYIPASNVKGSRILAKCEARGIYLDYDDALDLEENHQLACKTIANKMKWSNVFVGGVFDGDHYWIMSDALGTPTVNTKTPKTLYPACECCDSHCSAHKGKNWCDQNANTVLYRVDTQDETGTAMCAGCAQDAMDSGLFTTKDAI